MEFPLVKGCQQILIHYEAMALLLYGCQPAVPLYYYLWVVCSLLAGSKASDEFHSLDLQSKER